MCYLETRHVVHLRTCYYFALVHAANKLIERRAAIVVMLFQFLFAVVTNAPKLVLPNRRQITRAHRHCIAAADVVAADCRQQSC